ncbi:ATP-dependent DNA helicase [Trichonephila clavipes]|nr:ATP-dependent DNA helicase [Trichonephila clavipes]
MFAGANQIPNRLDEVTTYQQGLYISSSETVWRLLNFPIHQRYPTVVHFAVHLKGGQRVYYEPGQPTSHLTDTPPKTTLTAFFISAKQTLLQKHCYFPGYVTDNALARVYTVHPNNREAFHMRLLLHHVRGPISFEDLKTVIVRDEDGDILEIKPCSTYTEACQVLGLLEDDSHWYQAMEEAAVSQSPAQLHKILSITGNKLALYGLPEPVHDQPELTSKDVLREISYDVQALRAYVAANVPRLTPDQQQAFIAITGIIGSERGGIVFLDAPGGTGKTFLLNLLLAFVRKDKDMAVAIASSGIAATLLDGGRTANSAFKLQLDLAKSDSATCNISKDTGQGHVLKTCKLIVWDEAPMSHRNAFHALDKT